MEQLPEVAKSFQHHCAKCEQERFHKVLAHTTATSAKIECEICHKKSTFKIGAPKKKATTPRVPGAKKKAEAAAAKRTEWQSKLDSHKGPTKGYTIKEKFTANDKIEHPKFGAGFVTSVSGDRVYVLFEEGEKTLIHGK